MIAFLLRRIILGLITTLFISVLSFAVIVAPPGDFASFYTANIAADMGIYPGDPQYDEIELGLRVQFNLDKPIVLQYLHWGWRLFHGNLGLSLPKTNVGVIYTVEPFQGSLSDQRSAASRHALDA